jgi:hypothetical protein
MITDNVSHVTFSAPETSPRRRTPLTPTARPVCAIGTYFLDRSRIFPLAPVSRPALDDHPASCPICIGVVSTGFKCDRGMTLITHRHPVLR